VIRMFIASRYVDSRVSGSAILLLAALTLAITACTAPSPDATLKALLEQAEAVIPEEMPTFEDNPELVALGEALFWDPILSGNRDIACATCHHPDFGTGDGIPLSVGTGATGLGPERSLGEGREFVPRNATEIFNRGLPGWTTMFWDRRVFAIEDGVHFGSPAAYRLPAGLENILAAQAMFPVLSRDEMRGDRGDLDVYGAPNEIAAINDKYVDEIWAAIMRRVLEIPDYVDLFANVFPAMPVDELGFQHAANAIAAYEAQTFTFLDSPFDRYLLGEEDALSEAARRGALLFYGEAGCAACHSGLLLTDQLPHNIGAPQLGPGKGVNDPLDPGVMLVSGEMDDRYSFRTPPLRNVALTAPYFHNGAYDDLADVILHHLDPAAALREYSGAHLPAALQSMVQRDAATQDAILAWLDPEIENLPSLSGEQIADLLVFLDALTSPTARDMSGLIPVSVPSGLPAGGALIP
nr:methylamine utilization protein MauG [Anaerolineae bacterium]